QELIDHIIDHCYWTASGSLKSCGLVCKRWLGRSRYHLFSHVHLPNPQLQYFVDVVESSSESLPILSFIRKL
ncbi:hypothetical protein DFH09DRAFT_884965, partial [Mycena vulgaris]